MTTKKYNDDDTVAIKNLMPWDLGFNAASPGYVRLDLNSIIAGDMIDESLNYGEVRTQIRKRNKFFIGQDGHGAHASLLILDPDMREDLLGVRDPLQLTDETLKKLMAATTEKQFDKLLTEIITTPSEARAARFKLQDYDFVHAPGWKEIMFNKYIDRTMGIISNSQFDRDVIVRNAMTIHGRD